MDMHVTEMPQVEIVQNKTTKEHLKFLENELASYKITSQAQISAIRDSLIKIQALPIDELYPKFEKILQGIENNAISYKQREAEIAQIEKRVNTLEKEHTKHKTQLKTSLQTITENARPTLKSLLEDEKIPQLKTDLANLKKRMDAYSELLDLATTLTNHCKQNDVGIVELKTHIEQLVTQQDEDFQSHVSLKLDLANQLIATKSSLESQLAVAINSINSQSQGLSNLKEQYQQAIRSQHECNLFIEKMLENLEKKFDEEAQNKYHLSTQENIEPLVSTESSLTSQINSLQRQITSLKRIIGLGLTLFAGWYLWLQVQNAEFDAYFSR